jgi:hypothetical protein
MIYLVERVSALNKDCVCTTNLQEKLRWKAMMELLAASSATRGSDPVQQLQHLSPVMWKRSGGSNALLFAQ